MKRSILWALALVLAGVDAGAGTVRLIVRPDGSKVISNEGSRSTGPRRTDYVWLAKQRNRPSVYDPLIEKYCDLYQVDPVLVKAVIQVESSYDPATVSHKGARGLMQLMPETARRFSVTRIHDPEENIRAGVEYLSLLLKLFSYDLKRALAAYNAGENAVLRYGGIPPFAETQHYIQKALTVYYGRTPMGTMSLVALPRGTPKRPVLDHGLRQSVAYNAAAR
jgi:soluble lytic murein transglycosylase-like protein